MTGVLIALCLALAFLAGGLVSAWVLALVAMADNSKRAEK